MSEAQRKWFWANKAKGVIDNLHANKRTFVKQINQIHKQEKEISKKIANNIVETDADKGFWGKR